MRPFDNIVSIAHPALFGIPPGPLLARFTAYVHPGIKTAHSISIGGPEAFAHRWLFHLHRVDKIISTCVYLCAVLSDIAGGDDVTTAFPKAHEEFQRHGGILSTGEVLAAGIYPRTLYAMRENGELETLAPGVYLLNSVPPPSDPDLAMVAKRGAQCRGLPHPCGSKKWHLRILWIT